MSASESYKDGDGGECEHIVQIGLCCCDICGKDVRDLPGWIHTSDEGWHKEQQPAGGGKMKTCSHTTLVSDEGSLCVEGCSLKKEQQPAENCGHGDGNYRLTKYADGSMEVECSDCKAIMEQQPASDRLIGDRLQKAIEHTNDKYGAAYKDLAAESVRSLTDESVKPCPFCGKNPGKQYDDDISSDCDCILFNDAGPFLRKETWNNAWAHRRITELEAKLNNQSCGNHPGMNCSEVHLDEKMKIESLERRNAELEAELDTYVTPSKQRITDLERQLEDAKELSDLRFRDLCSEQKKSYLLEQQVRELKIELREANERAD